MTCSQNYAGRCDTSGCPGFGTVHTDGIVCPLDGCAGVLVPAGPGDWAAYLHCPVCHFGFYRPDHAQTSPVDTGSTEDEEIHDPSGTGFPGHWRCSCGYVGTDEMMSIHLIRNGWCGDCWGSGSDAYPSLGICRTCFGSGEFVDVRRMDREDAIREAARRRPSRVAGRR